MPAELVTVLALSLAQFLELLALKSILLPVFDGGRLLEVLPPLEFPDDPLFFHHAFETLDSLFQGFVFTYTNLGDVESPPFAVEFTVQPKSCPVQKPPTCYSRLNQRQGAAW